MKPCLRQRGVAAVEMALMLPLLFALLAAPLYIGRVLWHYTTVQKAAHDAARYLSTVSEAEMRSSTLAPAAAAMARAIVEAEIADLNSGGLKPYVEPKCDGDDCIGVSMPSTVGVVVRVRVKDLFFASSYAGDDGILVTGNVEMRYAGNK